MLVTRTVHHVTYTATSCAPTAFLFCAFLMFEVPTGRTGRVARISAHRESAKVDVHDPVPHFDQRDHHGRDSSRSRLQISII